MTNSGGTSGSQKNTASGSGVVYSGTFSAPIATATGREASATSISTGVEDELTKALRDRLAQARRLLTENHDPARIAVREDAIKEIDSLNGELTGRREDRDTGKLRQRLEGLARALTPVMDIIGGIAAFLDIINGLQSII